jgi:S-adenosylmethionine decarboxylase proenzyme
MYLGRHIIADMFDVNMEKLNNINSNTENLETWDRYIKECFEEANITLLTTSWHNFDKKGAFTVLYLLAESHLSIHTWPEHKYIALDVFTCGTSNTQLVVNKVIQYFEPLSVETKRLDRGYIEKTKENKNTSLESSEKKCNNIYSNIDLVL